MRIVHVSIEGLKGQNVQYDLSPVTIFVGPNGVGKTAVLQAVEFGVIGYDSRLGKSAEKLGPLMSGPEMTVALAVEKENGGRFLLQRGLVQKYGGCRSTLRVSPPMGEETLGALQGRVQSELGFFPAMFNVREFTDLSHDRRRAFIFSLVAEAEWSKEKVLTYVLLHLEDQADALLRNAALEMLNGLLEKAEKLLIIGPVEVLAYVLTDLKAEVSGFTKQHKTAEQGVHSLTEELSRLTTSPQSSVGLQEEFEQLSQQSRIATEELEQARSAFRARVARHERLLQIGVERGQLGANNDGLIEEMTQTEAKLIERIQELQAERGRQEELLIGQKELTRVMHAEFTELTHREIAIHAEVSALLVLTTRLEGVKGLCVLGDDIQCHTDLVPALGVKRGIHDERKQALQTLQKEKEVAEGAGTKLRAAEEETQKGVGRLETSAGDLMRQLHEVGVLRATAEKKKAGMEGQLKSLEAEEIRLRSDPANEAPAPSIDLEVLEQRVTALTSQVREKHALFGQVSRREALEKALTEGRKRVLELQIMVSATKALEKVLGPRGIQGEMAKGALEPLAEAANRILEMLPAGKKLSVLTLGDREKEILDLGWEREGKLVAFEVLSNGERLQFAAALAIGLLSLRKPPLKVLLVDDLQNVDEANREPFVRALGEMVAQNLIDNVVMTSVVPIQGNGVQNLKIISLA